MKRISIYIILGVWAFSCHSEHQLPILSRYIDNSGKEMVYTIKDFEFTNQLGQNITTATTNNKVYIANFFFTRCPSICPKMKESLIKIAKNNLKNPDFLILSFSIDPKHDTIPILKQYAASTEIPNFKWHFLNGNDVQLNHIAKLFRTSFGHKEAGIDFYHSSYAALVDKENFIRGFYNLLDTESVNQLNRDIKALSK